YVAGVLRVMVHLGMLEENAQVVSAHVPPAGQIVEISGDGNTDEGITSPVAGYFMSGVETGVHVVRGEAIGIVVDERGAPIASISAPHDGVVMLLTRAATVDVADTLAI